MTIKRRLFWSNIMMLVIPAVAVIFLAYLILFIFTRTSPEPMERAFPSAWNIMLQFQRDSDMEELQGQIEEFNQQFRDQGIFMAVLDGGRVLFPDSARELLDPDKSTISAVFLNEEITGSIKLEDTHYNIEQIGEYRVLLVNRERRNEGVLKRPFLVQVPTILGFIVILVLCTNRLLTHLLTKRIMIPLDLLADGARMLGAGELDHRIEYTLRDEFAPVCDSFNRMAEQLQRLIDRQRRDEESRKELLAGISHDLRTPLTSIKAYVEGLLDGVAEDMPSQLRYLGIIRNKAEDIDQIVDKLFLFSKLDLEDFPFQLEALDIGEELRVMCAAFQEEYEKEGLSVELGENAEGVLVETDPVHLHNVFMNVLENSKRYKDKDTCTVTVRSFVDDGMATVWMTDNGPGVRQDELEKIFDVFYRGDPSRQNPSKGSGLGLAISSRIMKRTGGNIWAERPSEGGLRIVLRLPLHKETEEERGIGG